MSDSQWHELKEMLAGAGVEFDLGLSDTELDRIQCDFGFCFPPDLRAFLQCRSPVGDRFPDWRHEPPDSLKSRLAAPLEGILFDVEHSGFWLTEWGPKPSLLEDARAVVRSLVTAAPVLIPIFGHRMIPDRPSMSGNPIFSVHQTDIIYYGVDLRDYLVREFLSQEDVGVCHIPDTVRAIEFWDIDRFQSVRWSSGPVIFDNRDGILP